MTTKNLIITPHTKLAQLLNAYPHLEDALIDLAPALESLRNPVLRETIARVTSLQQAASVGEVPVEVIVNKLRGIIGQDEMDGLDGGIDQPRDEPSWFDSNKISKSFDAREAIASGGHPVGPVMADLQTFEEGKIYELITPFLPAPLLDKVMDMGYLCWTKKENDSLFRNYFIKS